DWRAAPGKGINFAGHVPVARTAARSPAPRLPTIAGCFGKNNLTRPLGKCGAICAEEEPPEDRVCPDDCNGSRRSREIDSFADSRDRRFRNDCRFVATRE